MDMNTSVPPSEHDRQGLSHATLIAVSGDDWMEVDYSFMRPDQKPPIGESVIVGSLRGRSEVRTGFNDQSERRYPHLLSNSGHRDGEPVAQRLARLHAQSTRRNGSTGHSLHYPSGDRKSRNCSMSSGRYSLGSPIASSRRIATIVEMEQMAHDKQGADWNQEVFPPINRSESHTDEKRSRPMLRMRSASR